MTSDLFFTCLAMSKINFPNTLLSMFQTYCIFSKQLPCVRDYSKRFTHFTLFTTCQIWGMSRYYEVNIIIFIFIDEEIEWGHIAFTNETVIQTSFMSLHNLPSTEQQPFSFFLEDWCHVLFSSTLIQTSEPHLLPTYTILVDFPLINQVLIS